MAAVPSLEPVIVTSQERWRRWEQRGHDSDAQFMRRVRRVVWSSAGLVLAIILAVLLLR